jgi:hypothetical protein
MGAEPRFRYADQTTAELAARQHGVVGRGQLVALGLGRSGIRLRLQSGRLHRICDGVYAVGHASLTRQGHWMAAVLACGPGAVLSHWSAAELWRIRQPSGGAIHVTSPQKSSAPRHFVRHHSSLPTDEITIEDGIPVTGVPRTLLDLAAVASADIVDFALRESEFRRLFSRLSLPDMIDRYPGRRGIRTARLALIRRSERPLGRPGSPLEEVFVPFLRHHGLSLPLLNHPLEVEGHRYQVDCVWPKSRQIVELDGWEGHGTRTAFREDRARDRRLRVAGYAVTRLTWSQLEDEPEPVAADLRALLSGSL